MSTLRLAGARETARTAFLESGPRPPLTLIAASPPRAQGAVDPRAAVPPRCLNCDEELGNKFCPGCGQPARVKRFTFTDWFQDLSYAMLQFEHALPYTLKGLLTSPGPTIRAYLDGKRARTYSPVTLLFVLGGLLAFASLELHVSGSNVKVQADGLVERLVERAAQYRAWLLVLAVPFDAIAPYVVLRRATKRGFAEQVAAATMVAAGVCAVNLAFVPVLWLAKRAHGVMVVEGTRDVATFAYATWAYATLQTPAEGSPVRRWLRGLGGALGRPVVYIIVVIVLVVGVLINFLFSQVVCAALHLPYTQDLGQLLK